MSQNNAYWHPIGFILCHLLAALLFGSWLFEPTHSYWERLDTAVFYTLNGTLAWGYEWQVFWAGANSKPADIATGLVMIAFFLYFAFSGGPTAMVKRLTMFGIMADTILLSQDGGVVDLYKQVISVSRTSPSLTLEPVHRLSELVPWIHAKDASPGSFPGDHGVVTFIWLGSVWFFAGWRWGIPALMMSVLILLPRMVAGAHWLSDNLVGSATLVLLMMAWIICTPVTYYLQRLGERILGFILPKRWQGY